MIDFVSDPMGWISLAKRNLSSGVIVFVVDIQGSAPQECGAWMVVSKDEIHGTVGGGAVEERVLQHAEKMIHSKRSEMQTFVLGDSLGQCCGGKMNILFLDLVGEDVGWLTRAQEFVDSGVKAKCLFYIKGTGRKVSVQECGHLNTPPTAQIDIFDGRIHLALFGAGHIGIRIAALSAHLPVKLDVYDQRRQQIEKIVLSNNVRKKIVDDPVSEVSSIPSGSTALVMTHNHALDFLLVKALIEHGKIAWLGLIGSKSKAVRFSNLLRRQKFTAQQIQQLICPIPSAVTSKNPGIIALCAITEIMRCMNRSQIQLTQMKNG